MGLCAERLGATIVRFTMPRKSPWRLPLFLFAVSLLAPVRALARPQSNFTYGPLPVFELHSGFWINLHHTLYHEAKLRTASAQPDKGARTSGPTPNTAPDAKPALTSSEQYIWDGAVAYYVSNYATKDLLFSTELIQLKDQLGDFEDCDELSGRKRKFCDAGLPAKLTQVLEAAAPVYRAHLWPDHDRANRRWIMRVAPLVREQGVGLSERLADIYQTRWPREKIRVDLTGYANWTGAYTTADPLRVTISSLDSRNQGAEALEVLFHEGSHGLFPIVFVIVLALFRPDLEPREPRLHQSGLEGQSPTLSAVSLLHRSSQIASSSPLGRPGPRGSWPLRDATRTVLSQTSPSSMAR